ncbi:MAG TPA: amidohydrolase [Clostridiaceae bacterium]|nr:amidohydrolase [Clostridiaceae bacterium]
MSKLFEVKPFDKAFYEEKLKSFLPSKFVDIHTHIWHERFRVENAKAPVRGQSWPGRVAKQNPIEDLVETYKLMFPDKNVIPLLFGQPSFDYDIDALNDYVEACAKEYKYPALALAVPDWSQEKFENVILKGGFLGCKVYLNFAAPYIPQDEIRIFDFLPPHQLEVLDKHGWVVVLHIPRKARLKDPVNLAQMLEIEKKYPNVKLIIAHVGRAYCPEDVGNAFEVLAETKNMMFDFCANTNQWVFEQLIKAVGSKRILFGSDMPILRMRSRRICENGTYVNLIPKGLYGDVSGDIHMREVEGEEAEKITFFMYEEIDAFRRAAEATGLTAADIEDIFYNNAAKLLNL